MRDTNLGPVKFSSGKAAVGVMLKPSGHCNSSATIGGFWGRFYIKEMQAKGGLEQAWHDPCSLLAGHAHAHSAARTC